MDGFLFVSFIMQVCEIVKVVFFNRMINTNSKKLQQYCNYLRQEMKHYEANCYSRKQRRKFTQQ